MNTSPISQNHPFGLYGAPPPALASPGAGAVQYSPLMPGAARLEDIADGGLDALEILAPPGVAERRYVLAQALRSLQPGGELRALAPKDRGGARLKGELEAFGCDVIETAKRHHRICTVRRPASPLPLDAAIAEGAPRFLSAVDGWTQPGIFSWDRIDPGTALLLSLLPALKGIGADLGCGVGLLGRRVLAKPSVTALSLIDIDRRAVEAAERNISDARASFLWADIRDPGAVPGGLDFVIMNPPFHDAGHETHALGQRFIEVAAASLRKGGTCWMVANRHLPYEAVLAGAFSGVSPRGDSGGYKVFEARR